MRESFTDAVLDVVSDYAPNIKRSVVHRQMLVPPDLEEMFGLPQGHAFHGDMSLDQLFWARPAGGYANYRTPIKDLYLCGAGAHPGGGITGIPGHNASRAVRADLRRPRRWRLVGRTA